MVDRFARFVSYKSKLILLVSAILIIPSLFGIASTKINYDILSYLPDGLDSVKGENVLDEVFGNAAGAFLIVENMPPKDTTLLKDKILRIDGVENAIWTDTFADITVPYEMLPDTVKDIFYSSDGKSTLMLIQFEGLSASESTMNAVDSIKKLMNKQCYLSGMSVLMSDTKNVVEGEASLYVAVAVILAFAVLVFTMGSFMIPLMIMASIGSAVIFNMGTNFFGEVSYITQSIASILQIGITMDYSVFLCDRFKEEIKYNSDKKEAMANAISKTFFSVSGSATTTFLGFAAMCFMSFTLGLDIGIVMSKGVLFGVLSALLILPSFLLVFFKSPHKKKIRTFTPDFGRISGFTVKYKKTAALIFAILIVASYFLKSNVNVYYDFIKALPQDMTSVVSLSKLRNDFGMASSYFAVFDNEMESYRALEMADEFRKTDGVTSVLSLDSVIGPAVPEDMIPQSVTDLCRKGGYELMMIGSSYPSSTDDSNLQTEKLNKILKKYDGNGFLTGEAALSKDLVGITERDFNVTSFISITAVFIVIAILFRSVIIPAILISSIELAIFINEAIPFIFGTDVPFIAPTVIGCVQLGATVDYAILLTTRFKEELKKGKASLCAISDAVSSAGKSVFQSALVLFCATFGVYCVCNVMLVRSICMMIARGAIISMVVILLFLPALLMIAEPVIFRKSKEKNLE